MARKRRLSAPALATTLLKRMSTERPRSRHTRGKPSVSCLGVACGGRGGSRSQGACRRGALQDHAAMGTPTLTLHGEYASLSFVSCLPPASLGGRRLDEDEEEVIPMGPFEELGFCGARVDYSFCARKFPGLDNTTGPIEALQGKKKGRRLAVAVGPWGREKGRGSLYTAASLWCHRVYISAAHVRLPTHTPFRRSDLPPSWP